MRLSRKLGLMMGVLAATTFAVSSAPADIEVFRLAVPESAADTAWREFEAAARPKSFPSEWRTKRPTKEDFDAFRVQQRQSSLKAADLARDFYTRFPEHGKAADARQREYDLVSAAVRMGETNSVGRLEALELARLKDSSVSTDERFNIRAQATVRSAYNLSSQGMDAVMAEYERGVASLKRDFPKHPELYSMLYELAAYVQGDKAKAFAQEIINGPAKEEVKERARALLKKLDLVGKPLEMEFTSTDNREINVSRMSGKVVLVYFWATWSAPSVKDIADVKRVYVANRERGLEIVGISLDHSKQAFEAFVEKEKLPWPQFFDGRGWQNKLAQAHDVTAVPVMWLVDKRGHLRDLNARTGLAEKIERLLAE